MCDIGTSIERFVSAVERIAFGLDNQPVKAVASVTPRDVVEQGDPVPPPIPDEIPPASDVVPVQEGIVGATAYPDEKDRTKWTELCIVRGIDIPVGTRTTTLVKKVRAWDENQLRLGAKPEEPITPSMRPPVAPPVAPSTTPPAKTLSEVFNDPEELSPVMNEMFDEPVMPLDSFKAQAKMIRLNYVKQNPNQELAINEKIGKLFLKFGAHTPKDIPEEHRAECLKDLATMMLVTEEV